LLLAHLGVNETDHIKAFSLGSFPAGNGDDAAGLSTWTFEALAPFEGRTANREE
jgi:hypothetical protein